MIILSPRHEVIFSKIFDHLTRSDPPLPPHAPPPPTPHPPPLHARDRAELNCAPLAASPIDRSENRKKSGAGGIDADPTTIVDFDGTLNLLTSGDMTNPAWNPMATREEAAAEEWIAANSPDIITLSIQLVGYAEIVAQLGEDFMSETSLAEYARPGA